MSTSRDVLSNSEEMNGVPPNINEDEPLLSYERVGGRVGRDRGKKGGRCPECCFPCCVTILCIVMLVCAVVAAALGGGYGFINQEVDKYIAKQVALTNGSQGTKNWAGGAPVTMSFYMFNLTNKDDFLTGHRPIIKEIGPFVYNENKTKTNLRWQYDDTVLGYDEITSYTYNETLSNGLDPKTMYITTINLPLLGFLLQFEKLFEEVANFPSEIKTIIEDLLNTVMSQLQTEFHENFVMTRTVDEVVWGYQDDFLKFIADMNISLISNIVPKDGIFQLEKRYDVATPNMVFTGKGDSKLTAKYIMYNGQTSITGWGTPYAQMINGTEALLFHPGVQRNDTLDIYVDELFRSGYFTYTADVTEYGIKMYEFRLPKEELEKSHQDPGFNLYGPDGVLNLTAVFPLNAPVFVSKPHFLDADPVYLQNVSGPDPDKDKHDSFLRVEPLTGGVLDAAKRLQINIQLRQYPRIEALSKIPPLTYLPLLWVQEAGKLNSTLADTFKDTVYKPQSYVQIGVIVLAVLLGVIALFMCLVSSLSLAYKFELWVKLKRRGQRLSVQFDQ